MVASPSQSFFFIEMSWHMQATFTMPKAGSCAGLGLASTHGAGAEGRKGPSTSASHDLGCIEQQGVALLQSERGVAGGVYRTNAHRAACARP